MDSDTGDGIGLSVDLAKRRKTKEEKAESSEEAEVIDNSDEDKDSMIDSAEDDDDPEEPSPTKKPKDQRTTTERATSPTQSTVSTNLDCTPEALAAKFPTLFSTEPGPAPKILITTGINGTLHKEAESLTNLFPHSVYIPRSSHRYGHQFSLREISSFASNRGYTAILCLKEDLKRPTGLDVVHLPAGPTFHFSISVSSRHFAFFPFRSQLSGNET